MDRELLKEAKYIEKVIDNIEYAINKINPNSMESGDNTRNIAISIGSYDPTFVKFNLPKQMNEIILKDLLSFLNEELRVWKSKLESL